MKAGAGEGVRAVAGAEAAGAQERGDPSKGLATHLVPLQGIQMPAQLQLAAPQKPAAAPILPSPLMLLPSSAPAALTPHSQHTTSTATQGRALTDAATAAQEENARLRAALQAAKNELEYTKKAAQSELQGQKEHETNEVRECEAALERYAEGYGHVVDQAKAHILDLGHHTRHLKDEVDVRAQRLLAVENTASAEVEALAQRAQLAASEADHLALEASAQVQGSHQLARTAAAAAEAKQLEIQQVQQQQSEMMAAYQQHHQYVQAEAAAERQQWESETRAMKERRQQEKEESRALQAQLQAVMTQQSQRVIHVIPSRGLTHSLEIITLHFVVVDGISSNGVSLPHA